ncbi:MAG TPA: hypothetical protein VJ022_06085 [Anaerolineales bacterium]|nr:hypothetical protein [Anaerolineales bacterium]
MKYLFAFQSLSSMMRSMVAYPFVPAEVSLIVQPGRISTLRRVSSDVGGRTWDQPGSSFIKDRPTRYHQV